MNFAAKTPRLEVQIVPWTRIFVGTMLFRDGRDIVMTCSSSHKALLPI
jgi:hypothetical protein